MNGHQPRDPRPGNCHNRILSERGFERDKNPRTGDCASCGFSGACPHDRRPEPPTSGSGLMPPTGGSSAQKPGDRQPTNSTLMLACERLEAENTRMREALRLISDQYVTHRGDMDAPIALAAIKHIADLARAEPAKPQPPSDWLGVTVGSVPRGKDKIVTRDDYIWTGRTRVRTSWLGFAVIEREEQFGFKGPKRWKRIRGHHIISE